ncbi:MAG: tyrosine-protein phosphatase [Planctomycetaceae bacterium]|nr:tyrosine-protein phosphatase [Planctomycetaceae bacterium]
MKIQSIRWIIVSCLVWGSMLLAPAFSQEMLFGRSTGEHETKKSLTPLDIPAKQIQDENRPKHWGIPLELEGVPNFYRVTDHLYRSAQPTKEGMENLKKYEFETVVSLRTFNSDRHAIGASGLGYERIYMQAWHLEEKDALRFLQIATNPKRRPILVHCQHGADRTGTVIAVYRIVVQDWDSAEAVREMKEGGYGYHTIWNKFVDDFFKKINVPKLKQVVLQN